MFLSGKQSSDNEEESNSMPPNQQRQTVFIKPVVKDFIETTQTVYMVLSEQGKPLAVFDSVKACKHFAIRNRFDYHFAH